MLLPPAYVAPREGHVFSLLPGGGGVPHGSAPRFPPWSLVPGPFWDGYSLFWLGVPPVLAGGTQYRIGVPPGQDGVPPDRTGGTSRTGQGIPPGRTQGTPRNRTGRTPSPTGKNGGVPPRHEKKGCYAAGGTPLEVTLEDFLVYSCFKLAE